MSFFNKAAWTYCYGLSFPYVKERDGNVTKSASFRKYPFFKLIGIIAYLFVGFFALKINDFGISPFLYLLTITGISYLATLPWIPGIENPLRARISVFFERACLFLILIFTCFSSAGFYELFEDSFLCATTDGKKDYAEKIRTEETEEAYAERSEEIEILTLKDFCGVAHYAEIHSPYRFRSSFVSALFLFGHMAILTVVFSFLFNSIFNGAIYSLSAYGLCSLICLTWLPGRKIFDETPIFFAALWYVIISILTILTLGATLIVMDLYAIALYSAYLDAKISAKYAEEFNRERYLTFPNDVPFRLFNLKF